MMVGPTLTLQPGVCGGAIVVSDASSALIKEDYFALVGHFTTEPAFVHQHVVEPA